MAEVAAVLEAFAPPLGWLLSAVLCYERMPYDSIALIDFLSTALILVSLRGFLRVACLEKSVGEAAIC